MNTQRKCYAIVATSNEFKTLMPTHHLGGLIFNTMQEMCDKAEEILGKFKENIWDIMSYERYIELEHAGHKWGSKAECQITFAFIDPDYVKEIEDEAATC